MTGMTAYPVCTVCVCARARACTGDIGQPVIPVIRWQDFTVSERVAIGKALEAELGSRRGQRSDLERPENFPEVGDTRDIAAKSAGFGNGKTYEQAKQVIADGAPALVSAVDRGDMAVSLAAAVTQLPDEQKQAVISAPPESIREVAREVVHNHRAQGTGENEWYTPARFIEMAREFMGSIDLDPASSDIANATVKASKFFAVEDDGLTRNRARAAIARLLARRLVEEADIEPKPARGMRTYLRPARRGDGEARA